MLDELLKYHDTPAEDDFTLRVMQAVRRRQRLRRAILWGSGVIGAGFGVLGVSLLTEPLAGLFQGSAALPLSVGLVLATGAIAWLLQDEAASTG